MGDRDRFIIVDSYNKMICEGVVKDFFRGDATFEVAHRLRPSEAEYLSRGRMVRIVFQSGRRGLFEGEIVDVINGRIMLEGIHSIAQYVKEDVRLETYFETKAYYTDEAGQIFAYEVVIADISAGGIRLMSEVPLPMKQTLDVAIPYRANYIMLETDIIREISGDEDMEKMQLMQLRDASLREMEFRHSYGCKFHDVTNTEENMIRSMVFQIAAKKAARRGGRG